MPDESEPRVGAVAPWFGAKRNMASRIVEAIGPHKAYWEPFCGSLAVLFAKPVVASETVNDLHGDLVNLVRVLADEDRAVRLYGLASRFVFAEDLFLDAKARLADGPGEDPVPRAFDYLVVSWFGRNGSAGSVSSKLNFCKRFTSGGGSPATRWQSVTASIPWWHERLRFTTILNQDAFSVLDRIGDEVGTVIYCDPPYVVKGGKYKHDFAAEDHSRLALSLARFRKARVLVSYYDHPLLADLYSSDRWAKHSYIVPHNTASQTGKTGSEKAVEILFVNQSDSGRLILL